MDKPRKTVTLQDIADRCGVSRMTVSLALRNSPRTSATTRKRVREAAARLRYDPTLTLAGQRLSRRRYGGQVSNRTIGVLLSPGGQLAAAYFRRQFDGILAALEQRQYAMLVAVASSPAHAPSSGTDYPTGMAPLVRGEIDGLLALTEPKQLATIASLRQYAGLRACPAVALMHRIDGFGSVMTDDTTGFYEAAVRLLALGHRHFLRIGYLSSNEAKEPVDAAIRREALRRALVEYGLDPARHLVKYVCPPTWMDPAPARHRLFAAKTDTADRALLETLASWPDITAILCSNDAIALHTYGALTRAGLAVPERYSLVGFDDTDPIPGAHGGNFLSSVALPLEEVGRRAAEEVLAMIETGAQARQVELPSHFVARGSVGPAARRP